MVILGIYKYRQNESNCQFCKTNELIETLQIKIILHTILRVGLDYFYIYISKSGINSWNNQDHMRKLKFLNFYTILFSKFCEKLWNVFYKCDIAFMQTNENKLSWVGFLFYGSVFFQDRYLSPMRKIKSDMILCKI